MKESTLDLYTAVVLITVAILAVAIADIRSNRVIGSSMKRNSILTCLLIACSFFFEWVGVKTNGADPSLISLHKAAKPVEFCIAPLIGVLATASYSKIRRPKLIAFLAGVHIFFEIAALPFELVISIDENNVYQRGPLYPIYIAIFLLSVAFCIVSMVRTELRYSSRPSAMLIAILALLLLGLGIQMIYSDIRVDYLCVAVANYFLYNHRCGMILQMDGLTHLLNRRCYEKDLQKTDPPAVFLLMDVNNFKMLNDTYGNAAGDDYLKAIAEILRSVYGRCGACYRYGGDEFCVIMTKHTTEAEAYIADFREKIREKQKTDEKFPDVAVGYARYENKDTHIRKVLQTADEMMYRVKKEGRLP